ncbi:ABC transporter permease [Azospirillum sp. TSO22-1]|uniref:ABC transporter permease n=1 Tax=Azospirillum sp. TSO22-1 TaxID=716789 RepID=UPI000D615D66|nr:ABC transporter permease [Azospirillum sp. TSO22-1]PWC40377.1 ABC transporter permease [Azospirillum sp. TSO22-1]
MADAPAAGRPGRALPPVRPEFERDEALEELPAAVQRPLRLRERLSGSEPFRLTVLLVALALGWQVYGLWLNNPLLVPTLGETLEAFWASVLSGVLPLRTWTSLRVLLLGYAAGVGLATVMTVLAITTRTGRDLLQLLTSMLAPLPAIALLPLALLWFGLGEPSTMFVLIHSVLWPLALNTYSGFRSVSETLRMAGQTIGVSGLRFVLKILIPAAFPSILTGLKISWAFSWRSLIAAELVFGVSAGSGGLGWFIFENRNQLEIAQVFAGLITVILIGLLVEGLVFRTVERRTVRRWGMQRA